MSVTDASSSIYPDNIDETILSPWFLFQTVPSLSSVDLTGPDTSLLPSTAIEVLWYYYEKLLHTYYSIPYSPRMAWLLEFSPLNLEKGSETDEKIFKPKRLPDSETQIRSNAALQIYKGNMIAQTIYAELKDFREIYVAGIEQMSIIERIRREVMSLDDAFVQYYELDNVRDELDWLRREEGKWQARQVLLFGNGDAAEEELRDRDNNEVAVAVHNKSDGEHESWSDDSDETQGGCKIVATQVEQDVFQSM